MNNVSNLIALLLKITGTSPKEAASFLTLLAMRIAALLIACVLTFIGVVFIVWAIYLSFKTAVSPSISALITGLIIIIFSVILVFSTKLLISRRRKKRKSTAGLDEEHLEGVLDNIELAKSHPFLSTFTALSAGFLVGNSPSARNALAESLVLLFRENVSGDDS